MILNGRAALAAGKDDFSSNEEDEEDIDGHKYQRNKNSNKTDSMKMFLESMLNFCLIFEKKRKKSINY